MGVLSRSEGEFAWIEDREADPPLTSRNGASEVWLDYDVECAGGVVHHAIARVNVSTNGEAVSGAERCFSQTIKVNGINELIRVGSGGANVQREVGRGASGCNFFKHGGLSDDATSRMKGDGFLLSRAKSCDLSGGQFVDVGETESGFLNCECGHGCCIFLLCGG
jgi:hypothetical protein